MTMLSDYYYDYASSSSDTSSFSYDWQPAGPRSRLEEIKARVKSINEQVDKLRAKEGIVGDVKIEKKVEEEKPVDPQYFDPKDLVL